jgi:DNA polymerase
VVIDFETRSKANIKKTGSHRYAVDPSTEVLCLAWRYRGEEDVHLWHPAMHAVTAKRRRELNPETGKQQNVYAPRVLPYLVDGKPELPEEGRDELEELFGRIILDGLIVEAHNSAFERYIWRHVGERLYQYPRLDDGVWRCTAALAASFALPRKLEHACEALGLKDQKDAYGATLIRRLCVPAPPSVKNPGRIFREDMEDLLDLYDYCRQDVRAEDELAQNLRPLSGDELRVWQLDQRVNERGVFIDTDLAQKALAIAEAEQNRMNEEIRLTTGGLVNATSAVPQILTWAHERGVPIPDVTADTIELALTPQSPQSPWALPPDVERVFELRRAASKTSTKKYQAFLDGVWGGRVRDLLAYHGASTGRWAGRRVQPQNFPRGDIAGLVGRAIYDTLSDPTDFLCNEVKHSGIDELRLLFGEDAMLKLLANTLRGTICAPPGRELIAADYAAIEARVTFWLAGQLDMLEVIMRSDRKEGPDIYRVMAGDIYGIDPNAIGKSSEQRQIGKAAVLGLGFQMGPEKFQSTCADAGVNIEIEFAESVVDAYRERCHLVKALWGEINAGAIEAVRRGPGAEPVRVGRLAWAVRGRFLHLKLPSGRLLSYCDPSVKLAKVDYYDRKADEWRSFETTQLRFMGIHPKTNQWCELGTYGGSLTENAVQATARDLMRDAMLRLDETDTYDVILTVHDEVVSEVDEGKGDLREYEGLVAQLPEWADGLPVVAEGWRSKRFRK